MKASERIILPPNKLATDSCVYPVARQGSWVARSECVGRGHEGGGTAPILFLAARLPCRRFLGHFFVHPLAFFGEYLPDSVHIRSLELLDAVVDADRLFVLELLQASARGRDERRNEWARV
eukprot:SAG22_NODE_530_length_9427_cov_3.306818_11_plen_121_part_00